MNNHCYQSPAFHWLVPQGRDVNKRYLIKPHINISPLLQSLFLTIKQNRVFKPGTDCQVKAVPVSLERSIVTSGLASPTPSTLSRKNTWKAPPTQTRAPEVPSLGSASRRWSWDHLFTQGRTTRDEGFGEGVVDLACGHRRGVYLGLDTAASQCSTVELQQRCAQLTVAPWSTLHYQHNALPPEACCLQKAVARHGACLLPSALWLAYLHGSVRAADPHLGNTQNKALTQEHDL